MTTIFVKTESGNVINLDSIRRVFTLTAEEREADTAAVMIEFGDPILAANVHEGPDDECRSIVDQFIADVAAGTSPIIELATS